jgi:uncharacterized protein
MYIPSDGTICQPFAFQIFHIVVPSSRSNITQFDNCSSKNTISHSVAFGLSADRCFDRLLRGEEVKMRPHTKVGLLILLQTMEIVDPLSSIVLVISGFIIGFVGGMVGLVLGVVRFPIVMGIETSASVTAGTNLGVSTLGAITAALRHYRLGNVYLHLFLILGLTGAAGAFIGSFLTGYIPVSYLLIVIGIIVLYESYNLLKGSRAKQENNNNKGSIEDPKSRRGENTVRISAYTQEKLIFLESIIGFGIGFLGGIVGLVLGSIRLPAMISILKMEPRVAVGTNLAASSVMGISGLIGHIINNNIDYVILIIMGGSAMMGGYLGARYTNRFNERTLKRIIGLVLIVVAATMFFRVYVLGVNVFH